MLSSLVTLLLLFTITSCVSASGKLSVQLVGYENPTFDKANLECCSSSTGASSCRFHCYNVFKICISTVPVGCNVGKYTSKMIESDSIHFLNNAVDLRLERPFTSSFQMWNGSLVINVDVLDSHTYGEDLVVNFQKTLDISAKDFNKKSGEMKLLSAGRTEKKKSLSLEVSVTCDADFEAPDCYKLKCTPRNDDSGHYRCSPEDGSKICLDGWVNEKMNCTIKECYPHDDNVNGHYTCSQTGDIICLDGWVNEKTNCTIKECYPHDDNVNGHYTCSETGNIICLDGWVNETIQCRIKECTPLDDVNGHYACDSNGTKICLDGWINEERNCTIGVVIPLPDNSQKKTSMKKTYLVAILIISAILIILICIALFICLRRKRRTQVPYENMDEKDGGKPTPMSIKNPKNKNNNNNNKTPLVWKNEMFSETVRYGC